LFHQLAGAVHITFSQSSSANPVGSKRKHYLIGGALFAIACILYFGVGLPRGTPVVAAFGESRPSNVSRALLEQLPAICAKATNGQVVLVTGGAGFVGFHTSLALQQKGAAVVGYDNFNDYYPVSLKRARQDFLDGKGIKVVEADLNDMEALSLTFSACKFTHVIHLAAQAGVRYAARNPQSYVQSNIAGTVALFEAIKGQAPRPRVVYASSSSVYGAPARSAHAPLTSVPVLRSGARTRAACRQRPCRSTEQHRAGQHRAGSVHIAARGAHGHVTFSRHGISKRCMHSNNGRQACSRAAPTELPAWCTTACSLCGMPGTAMLPFLHACGPFSP
jgi:hypothetical protein